MITQYLMNERSFGLNMQYARIFYSFCSKKIKEYSPEQKQIIENYIKGKTDKTMHDYYNNFYLPSYNSFQDKKNKKIRDFCNKEGSI